MPDSDERLFSISKDHEPSLQDVIGLIILLIGYGGLDTMRWKSREKVFRHKHSFSFRSGLLLFWAATTLVVASVTKDFGYWWVPGIAMMVALQGVFFISL